MLASAVGHGTRVISTPDEVQWDDEQRTRSGIVLILVKGIMMSTGNGSVRHHRHAAARHVQASRPASDRRGRKTRTVTQDIQELGGMARDMAQEQVEQLRASASEYCEERARHSTAGGAKLRAVRSATAAQVPIDSGGDRDAARRPVDAPLTATSGLGAIRCNPRQA